MKHQRHYPHNGTVLDRLRDDVAQMEDVAYSGTTHRSPPEYMQQLLETLRTEIDKRPTCAATRRLQVRAVNAYRTERNKRHR